MSIDINQITQFGIIEFMMEHYLVAFLRKKPKNT